MALCRCLDQSGLSLKALVALSAPRPKEANRGIVVLIVKFPRMLPFQYQSSTQIAHPDAAQPLNICGVWDRYIRLAGLIRSMTAVMWVTFPPPPITVSGTRIRYVAQSKS